MGLLSRRPRKDTLGQPSAAPSTDLATEAPTAPAAVPTTWLAVPTLAESNTQHPVAGTSFHQGLLADTDHELQSQSPVVDLVTVQLAVVESGEYAGAVGVYLAGRRAGSVPAGRVEAYRPVVAALTEQGRPATCRAAIYGGGGMLSFDLFGGGGEASEREGARNFGLALLQPAKPAVARPDAPFLPPHTGSRVSVLGPARWDAAMPSRAKRFVHRRVGVLSTDGVLSVDGEVVGRVESAEVLPPALAAHAAGFPLTCAVRIIREPDRPLRVAVDVPLSFQG